MHLHACTYAHAPTRMHLRARTYALCLPLTSLAPKPALIDPRLAFTDFGPGEISLFTLACLASGLTHSRLSHCVRVKTLSGSVQGLGRRLTATRLMKITPQPTP